MWDCPVPGQGLSQHGDKAVTIPWADYSGPQAGPHRGTLLERSLSVSGDTGRAVGPGPVL